MNELEFLQKDIASKTANITKEIIAEIEIYMNSFDKKELFSFSRNNIELKKHSENYFSFMSEISSKIAILIEENARLASLLIKADKAMDIALIATCEKRFNAFEVFEQELYKYTSSMEKAFSNGTPPPTFLLNASQQFKAALNKLLEVNL